jgi:hypothetical protein
MDAGSAEHNPLQHFLNVNVGKIPAVAFPDSIMPRR